VFKRSHAVLFGALVIAIYVAGCGGGSDSSAPTKAEFIKQADAICTHINQVEFNRLKALEKSNQGKAAGSKSSERVEELQVIMPAIRTETKEMSELEPPAGDEDQVKAIISAYEDAGTEKISDLLDGTSDKFEKAFKLAQAYGFKVCGTL
jgi:hypothetical protein